MQTVKLIKVMDGLYRNERGTLHTRYLLRQWTAIWNEVIGGGKVEITADTFSELNRRLKPYGFRLSK